MVGAIFNFRYLPHSIHFLLPILIFFMNVNLFDVSGKKPDYLGVQKNQPALALCPATKNCISTSENVVDLTHYAPPWSVFLLHLLIFGLSITCFVPSSFMCRISMIVELESSIEYEKL